MMSSYVMYDFSYGWPLSVADCMYILVSLLPSAVTVKLRPFSRRNVRLGNSGDPNTNTPFDPTREEGFTLTAFRDGETFYLFCNDALYATVEVPYITAETEAYMGLTVLNLPVKITDYTFSCGEQAIADFS